MVTRTLYIRVRENISEMNRVSFTTPMFGLN
jgi:hypothetical protein